MAQFKHPNVALLYGVVIEGEPVSLVNINLMRIINFVILISDYAGSGVGGEGRPEEIPNVNKI